MQVYGQERKIKKAMEIENELISQGLLERRTISRRIIKEYQYNKPSMIAIGMKGNERYVPCLCNSG